MKKGQILIQVLIFGTIAAFLMSSFINWAGLSIKAGRQIVNREKAIQIAEAGNDYYRWHLAHSPQDYQDGTGASGPYTHIFYDKDGNSIGQFTLEITPPPIGSTMVIIKSTGKSLSDNTVQRSITTRLAKPSIAKYAVVANAVMRFGEGTEVSGPIHSNNGIRFDGLAHNIVSSSVASYDDPDHSGGNEFGVHTHVSPTDPLPPSTVPARTDVFQAGRQFPVPTVDFSGMTSDFAKMRTDAISNGFYRASSGNLGYQVVLKTNDTFDLYRVIGLVTPNFGCSNTQGQDGWGTWSIANHESIGNFPFPNNGIMFFEDDVFVEGQINTGRLVIVAALLPDSSSTRKNITVNNDLRYTNYDGSDSIGLIAQNNINVGMVSEDDLRIDAALIAQNGRIGRYYYEGPVWFFSRCSPYHTRQTITLWGMIGTSQRYGFAYTDGNGYQTRNLNYDANLLYSPPPSFPLTSDQYVTISWEENE